MTNPGIVPNAIHGSFAERLGGWQPIASAPREGHPVIIVTNGVTVTAATPWENGWSDFWCDWIDPQPTYWMPLPLLPSDDLGTVAEWVAELRRVGLTGPVTALAVEACGRGFRRLEQLTSIGDAELLRVPNLGRKTLGQVKIALARLSEGAA